MPTMIADLEARYDRSCCHHHRSKRIGACDLGQAVTGTHGSVSADRASATKPHGEPAKYSRRIDLHQGTSHHPPFEFFVEGCIRGVLIVTLVGRGLYAR
jgi:hypothetical protein